MKRREIMGFSVLVLVIATVLISGCKITDPGSNGSSRPYIYHIGEINTPGHSYAVDLSYGRAYIADGAAGLRIIDISSSHFPVEIDNYEGENRVYDVKYSGNYAYLACGDAGFKVIDVDSPFGPEQIGSLQTSNAFSLDYAGDYIYVADDFGGVMIIDVSSVYFPMEVNRFFVTGQNVYGVKINWPYLYVGSKYGFSIMDIENPYHPREIFYEPLDYVYDIDVAGHYIYIAFYGGLRIYDITNREQIELIGERILPAPARSVTVRGDYAYVAIGTAGLTIVRVANPYMPYDVIWYNPAYSEMNDIVLSGRYLYIANGERGMLVVEFWPGF